ncbi:MAG: sialate O-acetylesterase, partial [Pirellulaceae bacterium]
MRKFLHVSALLGFATAALLASVAAADVTLPSMFADHMVIQREARVPVWGWAEPGEKVTVAIGDQTQKCTAAQGGKWRIDIESLPAGGPHTLTVKGHNTIEIADVLVGEVWLCSGQSNMAMTVSRAANFSEEQAAATCSAIRMFTVNRETAVTPQDRCNGSWQVGSPETVGSFSAAAYFFGRTLQQELNVPIGLVNSSWGGTPIQAWTSENAQRDQKDLIKTVTDFELRIARYDPEAAKARYEKQLETWKAKAKKAREEGGPAPRKPRAPVNPTTTSSRPGNLFNGMIAPLAPYAIRGAIWYQGEANAREDAHLYGLRLKTMIDEWREWWGQGEFPFEWVQLPNYRAPQVEAVETSPWVIIQEQMFRALEHPNTGMAVTIDVGEAGDIHPKNKQDVGKRLALWALGATYGQGNVWCGPLYKCHRVQDGKVIIEFDHAGDGLVAKDGKLKGFAIAGTDKSFVRADARI